MAPPIACQTSYRLTVTKAGNGTGTITSTPTGINCGSDCTENYLSGTIVTLTANPASEATFAGWSGVCSGTTPTCPVTMDQAKTVTATFNQRGCTLTIVKDGTGTCTVTSSPAGINCGSDCTESFSPTVGVNLTVSPASGSLFAGWGGCGSTPSPTPCHQTICPSKTLTVICNQLPYPLTVRKAGTGTGTVTSTPTGIRCGSDCTEDYLSGTVVTLTADPASDTTFVGWSGACSGTTPTCQVTMDQARTVIATFDQRCTLTVVKTGTGTCTVTSSPAGINCGSDCTETFSSTVGVSLSVTPASGSLFAGWGGCGSTPSPTPCLQTICPSATLTVICNRLPYPLTVRKAGTGTGTVTSAPTGIRCGSDCTEDYLSGTVITLTANPAPDSNFAGWSGACSGTAPTCQVTMDQVKAVMATFNRLRCTLNIVKTGTGTCTVTSSPAGINCGSDCTESFSSTVGVNLSVTPASGSLFAGWGGCGSTPSPTPCPQTICPSATLTVICNRLPHPLTVRKAGTGSGTVTSTPTGITCGSDCTQSYPGGTRVTLTASAARGSSFARWSGCNSTSGTTCVVTVNPAKTVTATFNKIPYLVTVNQRGNGQGRVTSNPAGINCGSDCTQRYDSGTVVTLTATAGSNSLFAGWQGACSGTSRTCRVTVGQAKTVTALFTQTGYYLLTVSKTGTSSGTVTSRPTGINCGSDCDESYRSGTRLTLTARAGSGVVFAGWGGACRNSGKSTTCPIVMSGTRAVTATFNRPSQAGAYDVPTWLVPLEEAPDTGNAGDAINELLPWERAP